MNKTKKKTENNAKVSLWTYRKPYKVPFIIACLCIILENALEISLPFLMNLMLLNGLDLNADGTYSYNQAFVLEMAGVRIGFAVLAFILGVFSAKRTAKAGRGFGYERRKEEYKKIQSFSFANLDQFRINSLITRRTNDIQLISDSFCQSLRPFLRGPFQLLFAFCFAARISTKLTVVYAVAIPLLAVALTFVVLFSRPKFYALQKAVDRVNRTTDESLRARKLIRANAKKDYEEEKFGLVNKDVKQVATSSLALVGSNRAISQLRTYACIVGILLIGGTNIISNFTIPSQIKDEVTNITSFLSYTTQRMASLEMISSVFRLFTRSSASIERVKEVFASQSDIIENKDSKIKFKDGSISFEHVSFKYNQGAKENVLSDVSFSIKSGETIGILGETGSSKSTLIYLIERFYDASEGTIKIGGYPIKDYRLEEIRKETAIAFQSPLLFTGTIRQNLLWGNPNASEEDIIKACKIACCYDFIRNSLPNGLDTRLGQSGGNVSGGQRQRLCIARALLRQPKILVLDDSFSALDRITEAQLKKNLEECYPERTKIVISQKTSTIEDSDRIIVLKDGKINNIGTSSWLLDHDPIYQDIYKVQKEGLEK